MDKLLGLNKEIYGSQIAFVLPLVPCERYPLDDPQNDIKPHIDDLTDDSSEERKSRPSRGRSLGVFYQPGRKRSKTPKARHPKAISTRIRHTIKVPELDPFNDLLDRPEEFLSVYAFWRRESDRLEREFGPIYPPSA